jgi:hypothetical protein
MRWLCANAPKNETCDGETKPDRRTGNQGSREATGALAGTAFKMKNAFPILALLLLTGCQGYKVENGKWSLIQHNEGVGRMVTQVEGADLNSFKPLNNEYAKDSKQVYWETLVIKGADPNTFVCLGQLYAKDKEKVFWREREINGADSDSFQIVDGANLWSKDKKDFYFGEIPLGVIDVASFKIINNGWAKDDKAYYAVPQFSKKGKVDCDYPTMKVLSELYAVDKNRAYYGCSPIEGVDVKTFQVTGDITAKDKYRKYRGEDVDWLK